MDKKAVFTLASQNLPNHVTGHSPHQSFQQATGSQYGRFQQPSSTFGTPQPQYQATQYQPPQHQHQYQGSQYPPQQQAPSNQDWQAQQSRNSGAYIPEPQQEGQFQGSVPRTQQASPAPNRQQQAQSNPAWLTENIRSMHAASGQPGDEQTSAGASGPRGW
jgi:phospholipase D1/2